MKKYPIIKSDFFYCESVSHASSYELKSFAPKYDEESLSKYLRIKAKEHEENLIERTYIVRDNKTGTLVGWFSLQSSTLPYQEKIENTDSMIEMPISNYSQQLVFMYQTLYSDGYVLPEIDLRGTVEECE